MLSELEKSIWINLIEKEDKKVRSLTRAFKDKDTKKFEKLERKYNKELTKKF